MENNYNAEITHWISPDHYMSQYNVHAVGIPQFKCTIDTNNLEILNEIVDLLSEYSERKRKEISEEEGVEY